VGGKVEENCRRRRRRGRGTKIVRGTPSNNNGGVIDVRCIHGGGKKETKKKTTTQDENFGVQKRSVSLASLPFSPSQRGAKSALCNKKESWRTRRGEANF